MKIQTTKTLKKMHHILKKSTVETLCIAMLSLTIVTGCNKLIDTDHDTGKNVDEITFPVEIPFEEFSLDGTQCQWKNLAYNDKVVVINSKRELLKHISCTGEIYNNIDFSKNTLLLAHGTANTSGYTAIPKYLRQHSNQNYEMKIDLIGYYGVVAFVLTPWDVPIIVKKLNQTCTVNLIVEYKIID